MVKAVVGILITCDPSIKQLLIHLDKELHFILDDLDETHLYIEASAIERVKRRLEEALEANTYSIEAENEKKIAFKDRSRARE